MLKLFERIFWHNDTTPAINEDNLNAMSKAIDDIDNRVIELGATIMETVPQVQEELDEVQTLVDRLEAMTENPPYIGENGDWYIWDTQTGAYVDSGVDASITMDIADVSMLPYGSSPYVTNSGTSTDPVFHIFIPVAAGVNSIVKTGTSGLVDTYTITLENGNTNTFTVSNGRGITQIVKTATSGLVDTYTISYNDGSSATFSVTNGKTAYQSAVDGGYQGTEAQFEADLANFQTYANTASSKAGEASQSASNASSDALKSEGFAVGEQNGTPVGSGSPYYENSAKYYADLCAQYAQSFDGLVFKGSIAYNQIPTSGMVNGDMYDINEAFVTDNRFEEGAGKACAAGTDIAWVAADSKWNILTPSGVYSFNGRQGAVTPQSGDYSASDIAFGSNSNVNTELGKKANKPTILTQTLAANATSVTFTSIPTSGNNLIDFYIDGGANYTAINTATAGQITLTYDASSSSRTVYCSIEEVV